jgi:hypothetical protein
MTTPSQLSIYNAAARACGERRIASLTATDPIRYELDEVWTNNFVRGCLEDGLWNFALRTSQWDYDTSYTAPFGYAYRFDKQSDHVRLAEIADDEFFRTPLLRFQDEGSYIFADLQTIYVRYVSDGASYGTDYSKWPDSFTRYAEHKLALQVIKTLTDAKVDADDLRGMTANLLTVAKSRDAMKDPTKFLPESSWNAARRGNRSGRWNQHPYR